MRKIEPEFITGMGYIGASPGVLYRMGGAGEQTVVTGNPALLEGVKGNRFTSFNLHGISTQGSTTGAQLFDVSNADVVQMYIANSGIGNYIENYSVIIPIKPSTSYTISEKNNKIFRVAITEEYPIESAPTLFKDTTTVYKNITTPNNLPNGNFLMIQLYGNFNHAPDFSGLMLNEGSTTKLWEPYTGGKPSPSPEYPQEIESVGDAGEISVEVCGKNLIAGRKFYGNYSNGIAYIIKLDGDVVFPYKPSYATYGICYAINALAGKKYTFSGYNLNDNASLRIAEYANLNDALDFANVIGYKFGGRADTFVTYTAKENGVIICSISGIWSSNNDLIHICTESELLQIELGSTATSYEPYKPAQTLIVPTPNGLPGIPVSSGGNYTDEKGQQWVADEIDLAKGERVQRIGKTVVDGEKVKFVASSNSVYWNLPFKTSPGIISGSPCTSRYFADGKFWANNSYDFVWTTPGKMKPYFDTSEELNAFCVQKNSEGNPLTIYYCIETPIRTPLSPETIAAYKALRTYSPTTTVINDAGAGMSVGYRRK
mgnify:CR=1 FL=1